MTDDLVTWLRAALDDEEQAAREALDIDSRCFPSPEFAVDYQWARLTRHTSGGHGTGFAPGAPSPARVLREVEAKRRILAGHDGIHRCIDGGFAGGSNDAHDMLGPCRVAAILAPMYVDRDGYREEWAP